MTRDLMPEAQHYTVQMRQRGQLTIPRQLREALKLEEGDSLTVVQVGENLLLTHTTPRLPDLADKFADLLDEAGVSLADLLVDLPRIRAEIYRETYGQDAA